MNNSLYLNNPVFILGLHRTGSTLLNNMLNRNSNLCMAVDEMHIKTPWRMKTFSNYLQKMFPFKDSNQLLIFLNNIFSGKIYGSFWNKYQPSIVEKNSIIEKYVQIENPTPKDVLTLILNQYREKVGKDRIGVKYPLHFKHISLLEKWYPNGKIILLIRDIRAICASKINDTATRTRKQKFFLFSPLIHYMTILGFVYDYYLFYLLAKRKTGKDILLIRYEDIIIDPVTILKATCNHCEIPYEEHMIVAMGKSSSFEVDKVNGLDKSRIDKWKVHLNSFDQWLITFLSRRSLRFFGY